MKYVLSFLLVLTTHLLFAQKLQVRAGVGYLSTHYLYNNKPTNGACGTGAFIYNTRHWQYGLELSYMTLKYTDQIYYNVYRYGLIYKMSRDTVLTIANPAIPLQCLVNRKIGHNKLIGYVGVSLGTVTFHNPIPEDPRAKVQQKWFTNLSGGIQLGASYKFSKNWGANIEAKTSILVLRSANRTYAPRTRSLTAGVNYYF